ncbi:MAG: ATP-binding protein [Phycisphaerales bacterium]|nr:MAG: ATP-binding protein [Phycisphaerales bacterium]
MARADRKRQRYLEFLARCDQAFRPYAPIDLPEFFAGRTEHVRRLEGEIRAPGRQVALYGERGVGKTSLAKLAYFFLRRDEDRTHFVRCERSSTFDTIFRDVLASAGVEVVLNGVESEAERHGALGLSSVASVGIGRSRRVRRSFRRIVGEPQITPRMLLEQFSASEGLIIIDEYDRVRDEECHARMAELLKQFSDADSTTKIMLVDVADTLSQLIGEHKSLTRSLAQVKLDRMSKEELGDIIHKGKEHLGATIKNTVSHRIARLADGFPYFVHLICRHAAYVAADQLGEGAANQVVIAEDEYVQGLAGALSNAEHTLSEQYAQAVITTRKPSEKFMLVLWAMALSEEREVQVKDIAKNMTLFVGEERKPATFSWNLGELSGENRGNVLTKVREGYYKFTNPLMRPYVRSLMELENALYHGQQWEFPFMSGTK